MMKYTEKTRHTLNVDCMQELGDGRKYIFFKEKIENKQLRIKALEFLSQPDADLPKTIDVVVNHIDPMSGMPFLKVDHDWLIDTLYSGEDLPKKFKFNVVRKIIANDYKSLLVKDNNGVCHYLPIDSENILDSYLEGESITLFATGIKVNSSGGKYLHLKELSPDENPIQQYFRLSSSETKKQVNTVNVSYNFGDESELVEFKQSLVFNPKTHTAEIDKQVFNIMRTIAGFMNHKGGTLYIGVRNDGTPNGIENDLCKLNDGANSWKNYTSDWDGWQRKLVDSTRDFLGYYAASLIEIEKINQDEFTVAKISIQKSHKPIYVNNKLLYRRQCNTTALLTGDDLSYFIIERLQGESLKQFINQKLGYDTEVVESVDDNYDSSHTFPDRSMTESIEDERNHNNWLNLRLFDNGKYIITKPNQQSIGCNGNLVSEFQLKQYHKHESQVLLLLYNNEGKVNKIDFNDGKEDWYHSGRNGCQAKQANAPWTKDKNITIKCVDRNDMVVSFYQRDNEVYCYVRDISNINPSQSDRSRALFTQGHRMTQQSGDLPAKLCKEIMHIPGTYRAWIAPIVNSAYNINDHSKKNSITNLIKILTDIYPEKELDKYSNN